MFTLLMDNAQVENYSSYKSLQIGSFAVLGSRIRTHCRQIMGEAKIVGGVDKEMICLDYIDSLGRRIRREDSGNP